jgi:glycerol-3-phosphate acyltransferase PlsY
MTAVVGFLGGMLCAYVAGSINFAVFLFRLLGKHDPRTRFSGNAGVTNVYRQAGLPLAALVLVLDVGRAMLVAGLARHFWAYSLVPWAGLALILGSHFSIFHGWPCGKGVANYLGFYGLLMPLGTVLALVVYLAVFALTRVSFLGSFGIMATVTGFAWLRWGHAPVAFAGAVITAAAIVWFHRGNIRELLDHKSGRNIW